MKQSSIVAVAAALVVGWLTMNVHAQPPVRVWEPGAAPAHGREPTPAPIPAPSPEGGAPAELDAPPDPAPDPVEDPAGFLEAARDALANGGALPLVVLLLWAVARVLYRFRDRLAFLASAKRRAALVAATGVLAAVAVSLTASGPFSWSALLAAVGAALALYLTPEPRPPTAPVA